MAKLLKVTISGSFVAGDKEVESFSNVVGLIPPLDPDKGSQMVIKRYAKMWIGQEVDEGGMAVYKRVGRVREVFIDSIEEVDEPELSYVGKSIMQMTFEELQDMAAAKDLAQVPLYKVGSLATQRRVAFAVYSTHVLGEKIDHLAEGYNPSKYPDFVVDAEVRRSGDYVAPVEETIDREALVLNKKAAPTTAPSKMTLEQLKSVADLKKIPYHPSIGYQALHDRIYKSAEVA